MEMLQATLGLDPKLIHWLLEKILMETLQTILGKGK
jgi:hypothetical protein